MVPLKPEETWNGCATAALQVGGQPVAVLSPARILLEQEKQMLKEFQALSQRRLDSWEGGRA
jgi:hypothetical protein